MPKPLLEVAGRPLIEWILAGIAAAGLDQVGIVVGHLGDAVERRLGDGARLGLRLRYRRQEPVDGTATALLAARDLVGTAPFLLAWGDVLVEPSTYRELVAGFERAPGAALLAVNEVDDPCAGAAVYLGSGGRVERIVEKPPPGTSATRWNSAGVMVLDPAVLVFAERVEPSARGERELTAALAAMVAAGLDVRARPVRGLWRDVGRPEDLEAMARLLAGRDRGA